jgi:dephospho-CoA kinase
MITLGLTGSIGMGKSTAAADLQVLGVPVCNADMLVHQLLAKGGEAVEAVAQTFPETLVAGQIDRTLLGKAVFHDKEKLAALEKILHPLVVTKENAFIAEQKKNGAKIAVLEIPLLYETGAESRCDKVMVVTAPGFIQKYRVLKRPGMTAEKFHNILALQMPDREKRARADFVVQTGLGNVYSRWQIRNIVRALHA